ncbi:MAG TPA: GDP-mannose 4,6-dehydratase, partial [Methanocalculus sp.]|nr:GDP-mannose 4,6-dehydratase [Methanocalculus sp.]
DPVYEATRAGDIRDSLADITRAREAFGYDPQYPVEEGLRQAVAWFRERA